jgi:ribosomal protein L34E
LERRRDFGRVSSLISRLYLELVFSGGKLVVQYVKKSSHGPRCGDCKNALAGVSALAW